MLSKRVEQRDQQPENADRLNVLTDSQNGLLTTCTEFTELSNLQLQESSEEAQIGDIFRVHDFNYILKVIKHMK